LIFGFKAKHHDIPFKYKHVFLRYATRQYKAPLTAPRPAAGCVLFAFYPGLDNIAGTADPGVYRQGAGGTVLGAGAAFHAAVAVHDFENTVFQNKHAVRADLGAHPAGNAKLRIKRKGHHVIKIA
jgi:hypothetical protein